MCKMDSWFEKKQQLLHLVMKLGVKLSDALSSGSRRTLCTCGINCHRNIPRSSLRWRRKSSRTTAASSQVGECNLFSFLCTNTSFDSVRALLSSQMEVCLLCQLPPKLITHVQNISYVLKKGLSFYFHTCKSI